MMLETYMAFIQLMRTEYGCNVSHNLELQFGEYEQQIECRLNFGSLELFAKFMQVVNRHDKEQILIENNPSVKKAYEEFRILYKLANGEK